MKKIFLTLFFFYATTSVCFSHSFPVKRIGHRSEVSISTGSISITYSLWITELEAAIVLTLINTNNDDKITEEEKTTYFRKLGILLEEGVIATLDNERVRFAPVSEVKLFTPCGMTYVFEYKLKNFLEDKHTFVLNDGNDADVPGPEEFEAFPAEKIKIDKTSKEWRKYSVDFTKITAKEEIAEVTSSQKEELKKEVITRSPASVERRDNPTKSLRGLCPRQSNEIASPTKQDRNDNESSEPLFFGQPSLSEKKQGLNNYSSEFKAYHNIKTKIQLALQQKMTPTLIIFVLLLAFVIGALHGLRPGHGKTLVAAYLVAVKGTIWQAILLGIIVTITHTIGVLSLGVIVLFLSQYIVPEKIYPWLSISSGGIIIWMGLWMFLNSHKKYWLGKYGIELDDHVHLFGYKHAHLPPEASSVTHHTHEHDEHEHPPSHPHPHTHNGHEHKNEGHGHIHDNHPDSEHKKSDITVKQLLSLGIAGGIVPCPNAMVILLIALALHKLVLGLSIVVVYSLGIAAVLITVGIIAVKARSLIKKFDNKHKFMSSLPMISGLGIILVGIMIIIRAMLLSGTLKINF